MSRLSAYALQMGVLVATFTVGGAARPALAQEALGQQTEATQDPASGATQPAAETPMVDNSWFSVDWPKVKMPEFSWKPWGDESPSDPTTPKENPVSQALDRVADSSKRAAESVRNAWGSALNKVSSFGSGPKEEAVAKSEGPGFFSRLFGGATEPESPQPVSEFLAQERGKTTLK